MAKTLDYTKNQRGLKFVEIGMKVENTYENKFGTIKGENSSGNLQVLFDGDERPQNCHPTWAMRYFDKDNNIIAEYPE